MSPSPSAALLPPTMERILDPSGVTFDAAARTLTFTATVPLSLAHILRVVNLTRGEFYFDSTGSNGQGLTQSATYASPVLTLHHRLDGAENADTLAVLYDDGSAGGGGGGGGGDASAALQTQQLTELKSIAGLQIPAHNHITGIPDLQTPTQIVYRTGGAGGTVVGTLNLVYSGGKLVSVERV